MKRHLLLTLALVFALTACGTQATVPPSPIASPIPPSPPPPTRTPEPAATATPAASSTPSAADLLVPAAQQEGQLNVIALPPDWMNYGAVIQAFEREYGITVNSMNPNASSAAELDAIRLTKSKDRESAPDVVDVGLPFAVQAKQAALLQPYKVATWDTIPDSAKDADAFWYGDYYGLIVFEVNPKVASPLPQDWPDLLNPALKIGKLADPAEAYKGMMAVYSASVANGGSLDDSLPGLRFFQKINHNGSLLDLRPNSDTIASGETPIALNWDYLALADQQARADGSIRVIVPRSGNVAGLYAQGISAYAPHPNAAKLWMEFLYSDEGQLLLLEGLGHPVRFADLSARGVIPAELLSRLLPPEPYLNALFPTAVQISSVDKSILASWKSYVP